MKKYKINITYNKIIEINDIFIKVLKKFLFKTNNILSITNVNLNQQENGDK